MGIFEYLLGPNDKDPDDVQPPPSKGGSGPDIDVGRSKTETEKDLRNPKATGSTQRSNILSLHR